MSASLSSEDVNLALSKAWRSCCDGLHSLNPAGYELPGLMELLCPVAPDYRMPIAEGLIRWVGASREQFKRNIFFDCQALVTWLNEQAGTSADPVLWLEQQFTLLEEVFELFGGGTAIRFSYVHDFMYGFDWSRWIQKHPEDQCHHPYSEEFLRIMIRRGEEILEEIAPDDAVYPELKAGGFRNRFNFQREPEQEAHLLKVLAGRDGIPLKAWDASAVFPDTRDFHAERKALALAEGYMEVADER